MRHGTGATGHLRDPETKIPILLIGYAVTVLNTMPVWLAELSQKSGGSSTAAGLVASLLLLSATAGCLAGPGLPRPSGPRIAAGTVLACVIGAAAVPVFGLASLVAGSVLAGVSMGVVLSVPLSLGLHSQKALRVFGYGMSLGCVVSFVLLVFLALAGLNSLPFLAALAGLQLAILVRSVPAGGRPDYGAFAWARDISLFPFFVLMGAYWALLELFAIDLGVRSLSGWLAASLLFSALGSFLAGLASSRLRRWLQLAGLLIAALAGGLTYAAFSETALGLMILCNAFGLFLFFPLYLEATDSPPFGMARYLLGFALGGGAGSLLVALGGYPALAVAVAVSGAVAVPGVLRAGSGTAR